MSTKNVKNKEILEAFFAQSDIIFRLEKNSISAIDKATELSMFLFLKKLSEGGLDKSFVKEYGVCTWHYLEQGKVDKVNTLIRDYLNQEYENIFTEDLIQVNSQSAKELAGLVNSLFRMCNMEVITDMKGYALEYYQKDSKDRKIGEFFTPSNIIEFMVELSEPTIYFKDSNSNQGNRGIEYIEKIYDPTCGSGSFLIQCYRYYLKKYEAYGVTKRDLKDRVIFGNELKASTVLLAKMNLILLGADYHLISNENALSYQKVTQLEKVKEDNQYCFVDEENVAYRREEREDEKVLVPYDIRNNEPVIEQPYRFQYYLGRVNEEGVIVKNKHNGKYVILQEDQVEIQKDKDRVTYLKKDTKEPVLKAQTREQRFYRARVKLLEDKITPAVDYVNVNPVNDKLLLYHKGYFGHFDLVLANHPYGLEEPKKPDELFIRHMLKAVSLEGRIVCIVGETLLFHENYTDFRRELQSNYTIEGIISLPQGVFQPYSDVKTSILLIKKEKAPKQHKSWLVDLHDIMVDSFSHQESLDTEDHKMEDDLEKAKMLWNQWGGLLKEDSFGNNTYESYHKEEVGFAEFHKLNEKNWCVKRYMTPLLSIKSKYGLKPMNEILIRHKEIVLIEDNVEYKLVTVKMNQGGVVLRDILKGIHIGTKRQYRVKAGQFIISKIDARNGAYGIVPEDLNGAVITGNFWAYNLNTNIVTLDYLTNLMRHRFFLQMCNMCSYGSTNRWYLDEDTFNNFKIPIPDETAVFDQIDLCIGNIKKAEDTIQRERESIMGIIDEIIGHDTM